jgi:glucoamylase
MISEQLWDGDDLPNGQMLRGKPTGAAMPLCWSQAEYIALVRSYRDGVCFDRVEPAFQRYVVEPKPIQLEIWSFRHQLRSIAVGRNLRTVIAAEATVVWSSDGWATTNHFATTKVDDLDLWFSDLPAATLLSGIAVEFTFFWVAAQQWEGQNWRVQVL